MKTAPWKSAQECRKLTPLFPSRLSGGFSALLTVSGDSDPIQGDHCCNVKIFTQCGIIRDQNEYTVSPARIATSFAEMAGTLGFCAIGRNHVGQK
ncbi:MAG: hypothetical protein R3D43_11800 [Tepidamorphaceae bacterium]